MCQTGRQDDPTITDEDRLFRRVPLYQIVKDEDTGYARVSTAAFRDKELSVNIESVLLQNGEAADICLRNHRGFKLVSIIAGRARELHQIVCPDPVPPDNISHGLIYGSKNSRSVHQGLRDSAQWVIPGQAPLYADIAQERKMLGIAEQ